MSEQSSTPRLAHREPRVGLGSIDGDHNVGVEVEASNHPPTRGDYQR